MDHKPNPLGDGLRRDVFLSHASPDKEQHVRPFSEELARRGISFWLDEAEIDWGDSITRKINEGLSLSRYVVVFLSPDFMGRNWAEAELAAALNRENSEGETVVLPVIIGEARQVLARYPLLRDKLYLDGRKGPNFLADRLVSRLRRAKSPTVRPGYAHTTPNAAASEWRTYTNRRFGFSVDYPSWWPTGEESSSGDGASLYTGNPDIDIRVYGAIKHSWTDPFTTLQEPNARLHQIKLDDGSEASVIVAKNDGVVTYHVVLLASDLIINLYAQVSHAFFDAHEMPLQRVGRSLRVDASFRTASRAPNPRA